VAWPILGCQKAQKIRENSALFGNPDEASIQQVAMPASSSRIWQYSGFSVSLLLAGLGLAGLVALGLSGLTGSWDFGGVCGLGRG